MVNLVHLVTIDKDRLLRKLGSLGARRTQAAGPALRVSLALEEP